MKIKILLIVLAVSFAFCSSSFAAWDWIKKNIQEFADEKTESIKQTALSETEIGQGLKEALKVGINNAVSAVSQSGGYFENENIKIPLPKQLRFLDTTLRKINMGSQIDAFVLSMNQAAESAAPAARDIFLDALFEMNIEDAQKIFQGGDTAATDFFKEKTYQKLADAFRPTVDQALQKYDVTDQYDSLIEKYQNIPFASKVNLLSPDEYVITKALDGLFFVLGQEEAKIRADPAARVTDILKKVFQ